MQRVLKRQMTAVCSSTAEVVCSTTELEQAWPGVAS